MLLRPHFIASLFVALSGCVTTGGGGGALVSTSKRVEFEQLRFDTRVDLPVGAALATAGVTLVVIRPMLALSTCRASCTPPQLNPLDAQVRNARWADPTVARTIGDAVGYGLLPTLALTSALVGMAEGESLAQAAEDTWIIEEAFALSHVLESTIKYTSGRARPDTTFATPGAKVNDPSDLYTSMVSGHAAAGFSVAVATGVVATMRKRPSAPWLWLAGLSVATLSSYLRIAADRHYFTDVLAGAALGSFLGVAVPLLFHGVSSPVTFVPQVSSSGGGVSVSGRF